MDWILWFYFSLFYCACCFFLVIIPASFGISLGMRERYVNFLLKVFKFGYERILSSNSLNEAASGIIDHTPATPRTPIPKNMSFGTLQNHFRLGDVCDFARSGIESIIEDDVTKRFDAAVLPSWNLLTRTNLNYQFLSIRLTIIWVIGFFVRYFIFLPVRVTLLLIGLGTLIISMAIFPQIPNQRLSKWLSKWSTLISFRIMARGISAVVRFHNRENMAKGGGICVANHTTPLDAILLACDRNYALIGQMQGGIMGAVQKALLKGQDHIFFERSEVNDRLLVVKRMKEHVDDEKKNPILIFPEGTCINNTSVMMFKKGSFEVGGVIYPVAIKYDPTFGNAFWNSMKEPMAQYILNMLTSWAIVCDIWYLPPQTMMENENAIQFANRIKKDIAKQGGLVDLVWDGGLKRGAVSPRLIQQEQQKFATRLKSE